MPKRNDRADECPAELNDEIVRRAMQDDDPKMHIGHLKAFCTDENDVESALLTAAKWGVKIIVAGLAIVVIVGPVLKALEPAFGAVGM